MLTFHPVKFIEEVRARPGLYDREHPIDRSEKLRLWKEVGEALFPDWKSYSKATAYDRVLQLKKKWRSFRDAYSRELRLRRSDPADRSRKVYRFFKRMTFLGGFDEDISPDEEEDEEENEEKLLYPMPKYKGDNENSTPTEEEPVDTPAAPAKKTKRKKRKRNSSGSIQAMEEYELPLPMFSSVGDNDCDSDRLFLLSFVPEMRQLPVHIKMWARAQIANVMQEAVSSHYNNTMPRTSIENGIKRNNHDVSE